MPRYQAIEGSQSCHCCFGATVVDTTKPVMIGDEHWRGQFEDIAETFDMATAETIANALNLTRVDL